MDHDTMPLLIVITHFINLFCVVLLIRSGLHILADHPKLYWTDHTTDDNHWLKFGKKKMPKDEIWTAHDEVEKIGRYALPGGTHKDFGAARNWHFASAIIWVITGAIYWGFLFFSGAWQRLLPTSWDVFPRAWESLVHYAQFQAPPLSAFQPYDALQQLAYAGVVFVLAPLMILTAFAMSPAFVNRFPKYLALFGGRRQVARSLHFVGMMAFSVFILIHVTLVALVYFYRNVKLITFGTTDVDLAAALTVFVAGILFVLVFNVWASWFTINRKLKARQMLVGFITPFIYGLFGRMTSRQKYKKEDISEFFRVNGYPPKTDEFKELAANDYKDWRLAVGGMVEAPLQLSLDDIKQLPKQEQITKHVCIQGWTAVGQWGGVHMKEIIDKCKPSEEAKYVVFRAYDIDDKGEEFYEALRLKDMLAPQTILAYEMNYETLPLEHGAPLRLRVEHKLGYKMVKYIRSIEFVDSYKNIGQGRGGYREDNILFDWEASV